MSSASPSPLWRHSASTTSPEQLLADRKWRLRHSVWMLGPILGFGFITWASFLYVGVKARRRDWVIAGVSYAIVVGVLFYFIDGTQPPSDAAAPSDDWVGGALLAVWVAGIVHAILSNKSWLRWRARNTRPWYLAMPAGEPPTPTGAPPPTPWTPGGNPVPPQLVGTGVNPAQYYAPAPAPPGPPPAAAPVNTAPLDVNTAGTAQLAMLPGFTDERARRVAAARAARGGFTSIEQFAEVAGLAPHEHQRIRAMVSCPPPAAPGPSAPPSSGRVVDF